MAHVEETRTNPEAARSEAEERLRLALDAGAMSTFVWYVEENRTEADRRMLALFGLDDTNSSPLQSALAALIHPDDRDRFLAAVTRAIDPAGTGLLAEEIRVIRPEGSERWISVTARASFDESPDDASPKRAARLAGIAADVTPRKQAEEKLRRSEERQAFLLRFSDTIRPLSEAIEIQREAARALGEHLEIDRVMYGETAEGNETFFDVYHDYVGGNIPSAAGRRRYADFGAYVLDAFHEGQTLVIEDVKTEPRHTATELKAHEAISQRSFVAVPLLKGGRVVAFLSANHGTPRKWTRDQVTLIEEVAERTWAAVERARAEAALRESEQRQRMLAQSLEAERAKLEAVLENLPVGVWIADPDGRLVGKNEEADRIWRGDAPLVEGPEEYTRYAAFDVETGRQLAPEEYPMARVLASGQPIGAVELKFRRFDGTEGTILVSAAPVKDSAGKLLGAVGINLDISERAQVEEDLRASEARFRALVTTSADVVYRMSPDWQEMRELQGAGFISDTLEPTRNWMDKYIPVDDQAALKEEIDKAIREKSLFNLEHRVLQPDGSIGWTLSRAAPFFDKNGEIIEWIGSASDITARRRLLEELKAASDLKDEFLTLVSHELRTPLTMIRGNASILARRPNLPEEDWLQAMNDLVTETERLTRIVDNMLLLGRLQTGTRPPSEPVLIGRSVMEAADRFRKLQPDRELRLELPPGEAVVFGVEEHVQEILENLLSNASKYSPEEEPIVITVGTNENYVEVAVADRGRGIRNPDALFVPFSHDAGADGHAKGMGIGLAVCKRLVEAQGGSISVKPNEGGGSIFTFTLPLAD